MQKRKTDYVRKSVQSRGVMGHVTSKSAKKSNEVKR